MRAIRFLAFLVITPPLAVVFAVLGFVWTVKWGAEMMAECLDE